MGVVYHAHYLAWFELGRTELMRSLGCDYARLEDGEGIYFPVREVQARYLVSARYDEQIEVWTRLAYLGRARVRFEYRLTREEDSELLTTGFSEHAAVDRTGRPMRMPADLMERLSGEKA